MDIVFNRLVIIDKNEKKAKIQCFREGLNLVSSSTTAGDGNYNGKSTLLKSLFYTLGADVFFDSAKGWQAKSKYYFILDFSKDDEQFTIIRNDRFFSIFNQKKEKLYSTYNREELSNFYNTFFGTMPYLKNRSSQKYVMAAPFALFAFSFIDQKHFEGANFTSFNNQSEFADYRDDIIFYHLGINNHEFINVIEEVNALSDMIKRSSEKMDTISKLIDKAKESFDDNYPTSIDSLKLELDKYKSQYDDTIRKQNAIQKKLYDLYDTKSHLLIYMNDLKNAIKENNPSRILNNHKCPLCEQQIENYTEVYFKKAKATDECSFQLVDCQSELEEVERSISLELAKYEELSSFIQKLETMVSKSNDDTINMAKSIGYKKCIDEMTAEYEIEAGCFRQNKALLESKKSILNDFKKKVSELDEAYSNQLRDIIRQNNVTVIDLPDEIKLSTKLNCSDPHVLSTIWYYLLNKMKREKNANGIFFPVVVDNPTDRDFDENNAELVLKYAFNISKYNKQVFVSKVSFDKETICKNNAYSIVLSNEKYSLLNAENYREAEAYLNSLLIEEDE